MCRGEGREGLAQEAREGLVPVLGQVQLVDGGGRGEAPRGVDEGRPVGRDEGVPAAGAERRKRRVAGADPRRHVGGHRAVGQDPDPSDRGPRRAGGERVEHALGLGGDLLGRPPEPAGVDGAAVHHEGAGVRGQPHGEARAELGQRLVADAPVQGVEPGERLAQREALDRGRAEEHDGARGRSGLAAEEREARGPVGGARLSVADGVRLDEAAQPPAARQDVVPRQRERQEPQAGERSRGRGQRSRSGAATPARNRGTLGHRRRIAPQDGETERLDSSAVSLTDAQNRANARAQIELHKKLAPRYAYRYSFEFSRLFQEDWHSELIRRAPAGARHVLDIGCGTGFFLAELQAQHKGAIGLDISFEMLQVSEQYVPGARLVTADAERMPFIGGTFDAVFCKGSLHHTRDHVRFLTNCRELCSADGRLVMSEPCNDNPLIRFARWVLYKKSAHFDEGDEGFTKRGIIGLCEQAGFEVLEATRYGVFAYVFAGFPDHLGVLRFVPGNAWLTRFFLRLDRWICRIPGLALLGFHIIIVARPRGV